MTHPSRPSARNLSLSAKAPSPAKIWLSALDLTAQAGADPSRLMGDVVAQWAARAPDRPALLSSQDGLSYGQLANRLHRYARWALHQGIAPGDKVALVMGSRPDYLAAWLGITLVGGVVALINTQLVGPSLAHVLTLAGPRHVIVEAGRAQTLMQAIGDTPLQAKLWLHGATEGGGIDAALAALDGKPLGAKERPAVSHDDPALLIYTSGTTGLPKAARVSHRRVLNWGHWFAGLTGASPDDRMYNCLPIHHSVGGVVATGAMLVAGGSVVLAGSFSASRFWREVRAWDCTMFQYIGELCRYLLKAAPGKADTSHRLRLICGNGLRGDIWSAFQHRFAIPRILEFYAATEGNFSLFNVEGKPGAIGRIPPLLAHRFPAAIVSFDPATGRPARGDDGLCIACARGEIGEAIGRIGRAGEAGGAFEGYTDPRETESKILRDVFAPGDAWFRTGDLMRLDEEGFFYFADRIGDTFRWKGENVATGEVEAVIAACPGVVEAAVYGVAVPGADGRAGMAALVVEPGFDLVHLQAHLASRLPAYARPVFLRQMKSLQATETFKLKKHDLARQGFDPAGMRDPLFVADAAQGRFQRLDAALYARIAGGLLRL
jgi:fatty-acyl-CoA synthase